MKKIYVIVAVALAILSCSKDNAPYSNTKEIKDFPTIEVLCDLDSPSVEMSSSPETRIAGSVEDPVNYPGRHSIIWKAGDQISQFSVVSVKGSTALNVGDVLNFSNLPCTLKNGDGTTTFTMTIPDLKELYGATSGLNTYLCAIYPATTFSSITTTVDGTKINAVATPENLIIPTVQDGTGWRYSVFIARSATFSAQYNNPTGGGKSTFHLMSSLFRLKLDSSKNITRVVLTNSTGYMAGNVTEINMGSFHYATDVYKNFSLSAGCPEKTITVENGGVLPDDLYIAVRELREGTTYTFTFTAEDGSTFQKSLTNPAGYANRKTRKVLSLGTVIITDGDWTPAS